MTAKAVQALDVEAEVARLRDLTLAGLRTRYRSVMGCNAPGHLPKHLLFRILAYRLQAELWGDLDKATLRFLDKLVGAGGSPQLTNEPLALPGEGSVSPGTLLMREWDGIQHRVMALETRRPQP